MVQFDLTSTLEPTDEQLQALMEGIGEIGRQSMANERYIHNRLITLTFTPSNQITEKSLEGLFQFAKDLVRDIHHM